MDGIFECVTIRDSRRRIKTKMDELNHQETSIYHQSVQATNPPLPEFGQPPPDIHLPSNRPNPDSRPEAVLKDSIAARKMQKADREKLRRDRLNEQFAELGNTLDSDRPKIDKASILTDAIQIVKDLTTQINRLKAEHAGLNEESHELTQEKNDLREEKASLKSDIESLNAQYQQRLRAMYPWAGMDHSIVTHPASYPFPMPMPMPMPIPAGPIPIHPSLQPYPLFGNQNAAVVPNLVSTFVPYMASNSIIEQQSTQHVSPVMQPGSRSHASSKQDSRPETSNQKDSRSEKSETSDDVATDLELKTPGSTSEQDVSPGQRKAKKSSRKESSVTAGSSLSRCSSSHSVQAVSSDSVVGGTKIDE